MHRAAVILLSVLVAFFVWRDVVELFLAWYSGAEPSLPTRTKALIWLRAVVALAAVVVALVTL